jgi:hypothetical protein
MTSLSKLEANEEAGDVTKSKDCDESLGHQTAVSDAQAAEIAERLTRALAELDRGRALFIAVSQLVGKNPDQEVAVVDPDTGRVVAYLVPAAQRHAAFAAARRLEHVATESGPRRALSDVLDGVKLGCPIPIICTPEEMVDDDSEENES